MPSIQAISGQLGKARAAHLLRRASFGPDKAAIEQFASLTANSALDLLLIDTPLPAPPIDPLTGQTWLPKPVPDVNSGSLELFSYFKAWFVHNMLSSGHSLKERMTYFYHTHLPADNNIIDNVSSLYYQNQLYRFYALGNYKTLFTKVTADNAMLVYIDNTLNDVDSPNENYAREMLELYSIGKGPQLSAEDHTNYTELDVQQAARVLTGLRHNFEFDTTDPDTELPRGYFQLNGDKAAFRHDAGVKRFSEKFGSKEVAPKPELMVGQYATEEGAWDEIVQLMDMIFAQPETARFICRKLYRFFVYYQISAEVERDIIEPLAATFRQNNYEIAPVLRQLFSSTHFYDQDDAGAERGVVGAIIKSPIDLTLGMFRHFGLSLPADEVQRYTEAYPSLLNKLQLQGIDFYEPIDVAGYPPYHQEPGYQRNWISPNSLARRYEFAFDLIAGRTNDKGDIVYKLDVVKAVKELVSEPSKPQVLVSELAELLFPRSLPQERFDYFVNDLLLDTLSELNWATEWSLYQSSSDDTNVRRQLETLLSGMLQSPEYQLC